MIRDLVGRLRIALFGAPATQGRGEMQRTPSGWAPAETFMPVRLSVTFDPMAGIGEGPIPELEAPQAARVDPPPPVINWAAWSECERAHRHPGWSFCCFGIKSTEGAVNFVRGIVRGPFGVHGESMMLGNPICEEKPVWSITHLRGGFGVGLFLSMEAAASAAEIAARLSLDWETVVVDDPANRTPLAATIGRTHLAWVNANLMPAPFLAHHRNSKVPPMNVWYRDFTPESRPTKEQMS